MVLLLVTVAAPGRIAAADVSTVSYGNLRTGWDSAEPGLGPAQIVSSDFGQLFATQLGGQIYAQPLVVGGRVIIATEHNNVYAVSPSDGAVQWSKNLGPHWPASAIGCSDLAPDIGITSTPVYDPATNAIYLTTKVNDGPDVQHPHWYMHALDPATGAERSGWPVTIAGSPSNDPSVPFDPMHHLQRPGLLLLDGVVYAGFGGHCDFGPYRGYVVGVSTTQARLTSMFATSVGASNNGAGIWHAGGGLVSDGSGRIFFSTGNGVSPPAAPGTSPPGTLAESVVRLKVNADGSLSAADFFSPSDAPTLDLNDTDLGSGGPVALPDSFGTSAHPHVMVQQGKDGRIFLLDRDHLGGRSQGSGGTDDVLGVVGPYQGLWGHPAVWGGDGGYVYIVGNGGPLRAFKAGTSGSLPALSPAGTSSDTFPYTSGSPVVTSDGTTSGSAVVWVQWSSGPGGNGAALRAYTAVPDANGRLGLLYSAPIGAASKFAVPATDGDRVFVGTRDGKIIGFGRPAASVLTGSPVDFGGVAVGTTATATLTLTATRALTVTGISTTAPFAVTRPSLPLTMAAGATIALPVSFAPNAAAAVTAIVSVATDGGTVGFSLSGTGTSPGLAATPAAVSFGQITTGNTATLNVQVTNTGTTAETISATTAPASPFTVTGRPANGTSVAAGGSFVLAVKYAPAGAGAHSSSITLTSASGTLTIPVSGTAVSGSGHLTITPATTDFGQVDVGVSRTLSFDVTNTGTVPVTITKAKAPIGDFSSSAPMAEGTVIGPEQVIHQSVTFTPSAPGGQTAEYEITGDAGQGAMLIPLTGTGTGTLPGPGTAWSVNGSAVLSGADLQLTTATSGQAGTAFYQRPVPTEGLHATFTVQIGGGTGGDGMTLALLDPGANSPTSVGAAGSGLGFARLKGVSVDLVTFWNSQTGSNNFVAVAPGPGSNGNLTWAGWAAAPTSLKSGTHSVDVRVTGGHVKVALDGGTPLDTAITVPSTALVGFTASTGSTTNAHVARNVSISTAAATAAGRPLTAAPAGVDFGSVGVGATGSATVTLTNGGGRTETVSAIAKPNAPYTAGLPAVGTAIAPGASVTVPITFAPTSAGAYPETFTVTTSSGNVTVPLNGGGVAALAPIGDSSWTSNGFTTVSGTTATLTTDGQKFGAGSIVNSRAISPIGLHATYTVQIGGSGATGADGLTLALLDASAAQPTALGSQGSGLGVVGLPATFVDLGTYPNNGIDYYNFAAVGTSAAGATKPTWLGSDHGIPALRSGTHTVDVTVTPASHIVVKLDGAQTLDVAVSLPAKVLVAFTAGVGGVTDTHAVLNPTIGYTS